MNIGEELQRLIVTTLKADAELMALINGVYDKIPEPTVSFAAPKMGYVSFGPMDVVDDYAECVNGETHTLQIDAWSRQVGFLHCKNITDRVKKLLNRAELSITTNAIVGINVPLSRVFRDPDGVTSHGVVSIEFMVEVE